MSEQEIIDFLKRNVEDGRVFIFMPEDIQDWCDSHSDSLIYYNWSKDGFVSNEGMDITAEDIVALPENYNG